MRIPKSLGLLALVSLGVALSLAACGGSGRGNGDGRTGPDIRGTVTEIMVYPPTGRGEPGTAVGGILVEGESGPDTAYDRAWVTVDSETRIYRQPGGERAYFNDLQRGTRVEVTFSGPVMESYPVQATASEVVILE